MKILKKGNAVSAGIGLGRAYIYRKYVYNSKEEKIKPVEVSQQLMEYKNTKTKALAEVNKIIAFLARENDDKGKIFEAHLQIIDDVAATQEITKQIKDELLSYQSAIKKTYNMFIDMFLELEDDMFKERVEDLKDVRNRLLRIAQGLKEVNLASLEQDSIVIAHDLFPSDTATIDKKHVQGIITVVGGLTSHTAIIAKGYRIPAILGVDVLLDEVQEGDYLIIDAIKGVVLINPDVEIIKEYKMIKESYQKEQNILVKYQSVNSLTQDGIKIDVALNIGSADATELDFSRHVDGVGLFRTEFLFMETTKIPSEEQQFNAYKKVLSTFGSKSVVLRTLDIGGDKNLSYLDMPKEDNPFLGKRAIRLCFDNLGLFKTQIKAALRASVFGNLWLMFPMVGTMDDIYKLKIIVEQVKKELKINKISFSSNVKIGVMIEIPSIIMIADQVAKEVDFASIGTNDLCQYLHAVDRMNPLVSKYYQSNSPSMFKIIKIAIDAFKKEDKPLSICGESAGDVVSASVLIGLGAKKLSMNRASVASIKKLVTEHTTQQFREIANSVLQLKTEVEITDYIKDKLKMEK